MKLQKTHFITYLEERVLSVLIALSVSACLRGGEKFFHRKQSKYMTCVHVHEDMYSAMQGKRKEEKCVQCVVLHIGHY